MLRSRISHQHYFIGYNVEFHTFQQPYWLKALPLSSQRSVRVKPSLFNTPNNSSWPRIHEWSAVKQLPINDTTFTRRVLFDRAFHWSTVTTLRVRVKLSRSVGHVIRLKQRRAYAEW